MPPAPALRESTDVLVAAILAVAVCGIVLVCQRSIAFTDFQFWGYDFLVNHGGYAQAWQHIVLVDFDDATFARLHQYPISRRALPTSSRESPPAARA